MDLRGDRELFDFGFLKQLLLIMRHRRSGDDDDDEEQVDSSSDKELLELAEISMGTPISASLLLNSETGPVFRDLESIFKSGELVLGVGGVMPKRARYFDRM
jgi:hypothetical protein